MFRLNLQLLLLILASVLISSLASADRTIRFSELVKKTKSSQKYCSIVYSDNVCAMRQVDARDYCYFQGGRLPSVRELAELAMSFRAKGVGNRCEPSDTKCHEVQAIDFAIDIGGVPENFAYSRQGFQRPNGDLGIYGVWSDSVHAQYPNSSYKFSGSDGSIQPALRESAGAVSCVWGY